MLRRLIFALVLVLAAFAGGAAINGPGLAWLQRSFLGGPTIIVDDSLTPSPAPTPAASKKPPKPFPTAKSAPLTVELPRAATPRKKAAPAPPAGAELPAVGESPSAPASALIQPGESPPPELGPAPSAVAANGDRAGLDLGPITGADPRARLASAGRPEPAPEPAPSATLPPSGPDPAASPARDWPEIRKRIKALGITRYTIEAEVDGQVRFTCVIPVDGLRAVGHHFEAEGDDEYQAAEAALRRIALWQATEAK